MKLGHWRCHLTVSWGCKSFAVLIIVRHTYCWTQWAAIVSSGHPMCTVPLITSLVQQGSLISRCVAMSSVQLNCYLLSPPHPPLYHPSMHHRHKSHLQFMQYCAFISHNMGVVSLFSAFLRRNKTCKTERGGSVVTHETLIREVPGSNPGTDQPDWVFFFVVFLNHDGKCWVGFSLPRSL